MKIRGGREKEREEKKKGRKEEEEQRRVKVFWQWQTSNKWMKKKRQHWRTTVFHLCLLFLHLLRIPETEKRSNSIEASRSFFCVLSLSLSLSPSLQVNSQVRGRTSILEEGVLPFLSPYLKKNKNLYLLNHSELIQKSKNFTKRLWKLKKKN